VIAERCRASRLGERSQSAREALQRFEDARALASGLLRSAPPAALEALDPGPAEPPAALADEIERLAPGAAPDESGRGDFPRFRIAPQF
jgi:hypothetical protein